MERTDASAEEGMGSWDGETELCEWRLKHDTLQFGELVLINQLLAVVVGSSEQAGRDATLTVWRNWRVVISTPPSSSELTTPTKKGLIIGLHPPCNNPEG
jgi:hypothetical protein